MQDLSNNLKSFLSAIKMPRSLRWVLLVNCFLLAFLSLSQVYSQGLLPESLARIESALEEAKQAKQSHVWTKLLIKAAEKRRKLHGHQRSINYFLHSTPPAEPGYQALLNLYVARHIRFYLRELDSPLVDVLDNIGAADKHLSPGNRRALLEQVDESYKLAFKLISDSSIELSEFAGLLNIDGVPKKTRGQLFDYLIYEWISHLSDDHFWASAMRDLDGYPPLASVLPNSKSSAQQAHPLHKLNRVYQQAAAVYKAAERPAALFELSRSYLDLLSTFYHHYDADVAGVLDNALVSIMTGADRDSLAMGLFQRGKFKEYFEAGDGYQQQAQAFYRKSVAMAPDSIGASLSRQRLQGTNQPVLSVHGKRQTAKGYPFAEVSHRNIRKLTIKAWKVDQSFSGKSEQSIRLALEEKQSAEVPAAKWVETLSSGKKSLEKKRLNSKLPEDGFWLVSIASERDPHTQTVLSHAMLVRQSQLITSVVQNNQALSIAAYNGASGQPVNDFKATLPGESKPVSADSKGLVLTRALPEPSGKLVVASGQDIQQLDIEAPLPVSESRGRNRSNVAKAVIFSDRNKYGLNDEINWTVLAASHSPFAHHNTMNAGQLVDAVNNITARVRLHDASGRLLTMTSAYIGRGGLGRGRFRIADFPGAIKGTWTLESGFFKKYAFKVSGADDEQISPPVAAVSDAKRPDAKRPVDFVMDFPEQMRRGEAADFTVGVTDKQQASRLYIYSKHQLLKVINIAAGVEQHAFKPEEAHEGGLLFELEWVKDHELYNRQVFVEVPWASQKLALTLTPEVSAKHSKHGPDDQSSWRLAALGGDLPQGLSKAKVLVDWYDLKQANKAAAVDFSGLYPQYPAPIKRISGSGWKQAIPLYSTRARFDKGKIPSPRFIDGHYDIDPGHHIYVIPSDTIRHKRFKQRGFAARRAGELKENGFETVGNERQQLLKVSAGQPFIDLRPPETMKRVGAVRVIVITPDMKIGQLLVVLR